MALRAVRLIDSYRPFSRRLASLSALSAAACNLCEALTELWDALSDAFWARCALISADVAASAIRAIDLSVACYEAASIAL